MTVVAEPGGHLHRAYDTGTRTVRVVAVRRLTASVTHFRFAAADDRPLSPFAPGSHLVVTAGDHRNAYSLVDDGMFAGTYGISVLRCGTDPAVSGSAWLHHHAAEGTELEIEGPRSMFAPVLEQRHMLLVAGGIGVTPILSHLRAAVRDGRSADVVYSYRPDNAAHLDDLRALAQLPAVTLHAVSGAQDTKSALVERLSAQPLGTHAYACGPAGFLATYEELAAAAGWPAARVHLERFSAPERDPGEPFDVRLASTGETFSVPSGVSLLQTLLDRGLGVKNLCQQGVCGECRIPVRSGTINHRDFVLDDDEKAAGDQMLCCVSRGTDSLLEVDL